jgi:hypothetical protein
VRCFTGAAVIVSILPQHPTVSILTINFFLALPRTGGSSSHALANIDLRQRGPKRRGRILSGTYASLPGIHTFLSITPDNLSTTFGIVNITIWYHNQATL